MDAFCIYKIKYTKLFRERLTTKKHIYELEKIFNLKNMVIWLHYSKNTLNTVKMRSKLQLMNLICLSGWQEDVEGWRSTRTVVWKLTWVGRLMLKYDMPKYQLLTL